MEASNLQIYWHESQPVYSLCFQPNVKEKLFTCGGDNKIRAWHLNTTMGENTVSKVDTIDFLSSLQQHEQAVNVIRFNHEGGDILASAGDDGQVFLWKQNDTVVKQFGMDETEASELKESWYVWKRLRYSSNSEIYDLCWSPNDNYIAVGCMDNCIRIFDIESEKCIVNIREHNHYVQGIVWDPLNEYIFSQSADRSVHTYKIIFDEQHNVAGLKLQNKFIKSDLPIRQPNSKEMNFKSTKTSYLFYNETLPSFFRRLTISPCGSLICVPTGTLKTEDIEVKTEGEISTTNVEFTNALYIYTRGSLSRENTSNRPIMTIPFLKKPCIVVSFSPIFYKLSGEKSKFIDLPYKLIFAVATSNEVLIYDTENQKAVSIIGNMHYAPLTDLSWSEDGTMLMISSTDGFCSYISINSSLFGEKLDEEAKLKCTIKNESIETVTDSPAPIVLPTTPTPTPTPEVIVNKRDIVNILPVKRKIPQASNTSNESNKDTIKYESPAKAKKRIQPTLIKQ